MNEINFIPTAYLRARARRRAVTRSVALLVVMVGAMAAWHLRSPREHAESLERHLEALGAQVEAERRALDARSREDAASRAQAEILELAARMETPLPTTFILAAVAEVMPEPMALTALSMSAARADRSALGSDRMDDPRSNAASAAAKTLSLTLEGLAPDDVSIARLIGGLDEHPLFENVELGFSRPVDDGPLLARDFQVTAAIPLDREFVRPGERSVSDAR